jgi:hypothetical protein
VCILRKIFGPEREEVVKAGKGKGKVISGLN